MLNNDLSNMAGFTIAFRCEDFLIEYKENTFTDKVLNKIMGKTKRAEVNNEVRTIMEYLYRQTEYNVDLVVEKANYTKDLKELLDDLPFNRVVLIDKPVQVGHRLHSGDITIYVDNDEERLGIIHNEYAIPLDKLDNFIKKRGRR